MKTIILMMMLTGSQAFAGATNTDINCKSTDGRFELTGHVPGDFAEFELTAYVDGKLMAHLFSFTNQRTIQTEENARIAVSEDLDRGVYGFHSETIVIERQRILLYALPETVRVQHSELGTRSSFKAELSISNEDDVVSSDVFCITEY